MNNKDNISQIALLFSSNTQKRSEFMAYFMLFDACVFPMILLWLLVFRGKFKGNKGSSHLSNNLEYFCIGQNRE